MECSIRSAFYIEKKENPIIGIETTVLCLCSHLDKIQCLCNKKPSSGHILIICWLEVKPNEWFLILILFCGRCVNLNQRYSSNKRNTVAQKVFMTVLGQKKVDKRLTQQFMGFQYVYYGIRRICSQLFGHYYKTWHFSWEGFPWIRPQRTVFRTGQYVNRSHSFSLVFLRFTLYSLIHCQNTIIVTKIVIPFIYIHVVIPLFNVRSLLPSSTMTKKIAKCTTTSNFLSVSRCLTLVKNKNDWTALMRIP